MPISPPHDLSDVEYDAIEAAVAETARGRQFLTEFARRARAADTRQLLDAMARLEAAVTSSRPAAPSSRLSVRLLAERVEEIARRMSGIADEMREAGVATSLVARVEAQARAVAGILRMAPSALGSDQPQTNEDRPRRAAPAALPRREEPPPEPQIQPSSIETKKLAALAPLDALPLAQKLALFR